MNESDRVAFNEIIDNLYIINLTDYGKKIVTNGVKDLQHQLQKQNSVIEEIKKLIKQYGKYDGYKCTRSFQMWTADFNKLLEILEDKEVE